MSELQFAAGVLARLRARGGAYDPRAYIFVLTSIEFLQATLPVRRHVTGPELAWGCRDCAREHYGLLAREVLSYWGIRRTEDFGRIVFNLVEVGLLGTQAGDREEDFAGVYDFEEAFNGPYAWKGIQRDGTG